MTNKPPVSKKRPPSTGAVTMATHVKDITIKGRGSRHGVMSTNQLLVADYNNNKRDIIKTRLIRAPVIFLQF